MKKPSMKKSAKVTYYVHLCLMIVIFALNFIAVFLNHNDSARSVLIFNMVQALLFIAIMIVSDKVIKKTSIQISDAVYIIVLLWFSAHFFLGEICGFYAKVKWWDSFLHTFSGVFLSFVSFSFINLLNDTKDKGFRLNIWFSCLFAFTLAVTIGVVWEIIEYSIDKVFLTNMQRAYESIAGGNSRGAPLVGQAALADTMKDLMLDSLGALISCIVIATLCKKKNIGVEDLNVITLPQKKSKTAQSLKLDELSANETASNESVVNEPAKPDAQNAEQKALTENSNELLKGETDDLNEKVSTEDMTSEDKNKDTK